MNTLLAMSKSEFIKKIIFITLGSFITATGINLFIIPSKLLSGGLSGISIIIHYLFNISVGIILLLLNIPLFILSALKINKKFTILTIIGTVSLSTCLIMTTPFVHIISPVEETDKLLYCIYGGVLTGIGIGIVFANDGSTGGIDIISTLVKIKYNIDIGMGSFIINSIIIAIGSVLFNYKVGLYTLVVMYISSIFTDKALKGFNKQKMLFIITNKQKEVSSAVMLNLKRGVTVLYGEGAYTKNKKNIIYCIVSPRQLPKIKNIIKEIDRNAFISIIDASEVQGKGFVNLFGQ